MLCLSVPTGHSHLGTPLSIAPPPSPGNRHDGGSALTFGRLQGYHGTAKSMAEMLQSALT